MSRKPKVVFAVACNKWQSREWWTALTRAVLDCERDPDIEFLDVITHQTATPDHSKNNVIATAFDGKRETLTDANRNIVMAEVEDTAADYVYWWDDDTIHPVGTLRRLLDLQVPFAAGLYYIKNAPYFPIAYFRNPNGTYRAMLQFQRGELVTVDFTGMGCALIHRDVYTQIRAAHSVFKTLRGSYVVVPNEDVHKGKVTEVNGFSGQVIGNQFIQKVVPVTDEDLTASNTHWPYYGMEVTRTEDIWFCELAERVGVKPLIDTDINCAHVGELPITRANFRRYEIIGKEDTGNEPEAKSLE